MAVSLSKDQLEELHALYYWRYELFLCRQERDQERIEQARRSVVSILTRCDELEISFSIQNSVLYESVKVANHATRYFEDVMTKILS